MIFLSYSFLHPVYHCEFIFSHLFGHEQGWEPNQHLQLHFCGKLH